jgi:hypothetical protein
VQPNAITKAINAIAQYGLQLKHGENNQKYNWD